MIVIAAAFLLSAALASNHAMDETALFTESVEPIAEQEDFAVDNSKALLQEETATDVQPIVDEVDKALTQEKAMAKQEILAHVAATKTAFALSMAIKGQKPGAAQLFDAKKAHEAAVEQEKKALAAYQGSWKTLKVAEKKAEKFGHATGKERVVTLAQGALALAEQRDEAMQEAAGATAKLRAHQMSAAKMHDLEVAIGLAAQNLTKHQLLEAEDAAQLAVSYVKGGGHSGNTTEITKSLVGQAQMMLSNTTEKGPKWATQEAHRLTKRQHQATMQKVMKARLSAEETAVLKTKLRQNKQRLETSRKTMHQTMAKLKPVVDAAMKNTTTLPYTSVDAARTDARKGYTHLRGAYNRVTHDEEAIKEVRAEHHRLSRETNRSLAVADMALRKLPDVDEPVNDTKALNDVEAVKQEAASQQTKAVKAAENYVSHTMATQKNALRKLSNPTLQPLPDAADVAAYNAIKGAKEAAAAKTDAALAKKIAVTEATKLGFKASKKRKAAKKAAKKATNGLVKTEKGPGPQFESSVSKLKASNNTFGDLSIEQQIEKQAQADAGENPNIPDELAPKNLETATFTAASDFLKSVGSKDVTAPTRVEAEEQFQDQKAQEKSAAEAVEIAFEQAFHNPDALVQEP